MLALRHLVELRMSVNLLFELLSAMGTRLTHLAFLALANGPIFTLPHTLFATLEYNCPQLARGAAAGAVDEGDGILCTYAQLPPEQLPMPLPPQQRQQPAGLLELPGLPGLPNLAGLLAFAGPHASPMSPAPVNNEGDDHEEDHDDVDKHAPRRSRISLPARKVELTKRTAAEHGQSGRRRV